MATIIGTEWDDTLAGGNGADLVAGGAGNDRLLGKGGNDVLWGGDGDDMLWGGDGDDVVDGGDGRDTFVVAGNLADYRITRSGGVIEVLDLSPKHGSDGLDRLENVEFLQFKDQILDLRSRPPGTPGDTDSAPNRVAENAAAGSVVGITAHALDPDIGDTLTYSLADDAGGRFRIDAQSGVVTVAPGAVLDFESAQSHTILVRATDAGGLFGERAFTIALVDVNEAPGPVSDQNGAANRVSEAAAGGTTVGITARAIDPDADDSLTYGLVDDAGGRFQIDAQSGVVTVAEGAELDLAQAQSHTITVRATDTSGLFSEAGFTIQLASAGGDPPDGDIRVNDFTADEQIVFGLTGGTPLAALADGGFVATWESFGQDGDLFGIFARRYDASGNAVGGELQVNSYTESYQVYPATAGFAGGGFVVTWTSFGQDGSGYGIYGQRYGTDGNVVGGEFQINSYTSGQQLYSSVAALAGDAFVVTWTSAEQDGSGYGIYGQRYDAAGATVGGEFRINSHTEGDQALSAVTAMADGGYLVVWESLDQGGAGYGVYGQRYDAAGATVGGEFRINDHVGSQHAYPAIAAVEDGGFVVTWSSYGQDGSDYGVYARRYDAAGDPLGDEFRVNSHTEGAQQLSSITAVADGFVVAWTSFGQDGSGDGVYGQRYDAVGEPLDDEFRITHASDGSQRDPALAGLPDGGFAVLWTGAGPGDDQGIFLDLFLT
ncbi:MAG TPA: cadherin domain-containing protein [Geminicoccaceae bacterium]|nr:cadherin domain-containing protein [Geminicoccaceae bacterium]